MGTDRDNQLRWNRKDRPFFESWDLNVFHRASQSAFWIRHTLEAPNPDLAPPTCRIDFSRYSHRGPRATYLRTLRLPSHGFGHRKEPFRIQMGPASLEHSALRGVITNTSKEQRGARGMATDAGESPSWNLRIAPSRFSHYYSKKSSYTAQPPTICLVAPHPNALISGSMSIGSTSYTFDGDVGIQSHLWGPCYPSAWVWGHCSLFREDPTAALELLSVRNVHRGPFSPTQTFLSLYLGSEVFHFREPWTTPLCRSTWSGESITFRAFTHRTRIEGKIRAHADDFNTLESDDWAISPQLKHSSIASAEIEVYQRRSVFSRFRRRSRLSTNQAAALQFGHSRRSFT